MALLFTVTVLDADPVNTLIFRLLLVTANNYIKIQSFSSHNNWTIEILGCSSSKLKVNYIPAHYCPAADQLICGYEDGLSHPLLLSMQQKICLASERHRTPLESPL